MTQVRSLFVLVLGGAMAAGCAQAHGEEARPARPVRALSASFAPQAAGVRYSATIEPFEQVTLAFKASGYIDAVLQRPGADGRRRAVQAGDRITRGTVLARVRDVEYRERVAQGRARLAESEAAHVKARLDLERSQKLFAADSLTKPELDAAQAAFDGADARIRAARADIELSLAALGDCALVSPATGVVLERQVDVGTLAAPGTAAFVVGEVGSVKARFGIPDSAIASVKPGERLLVNVEAIAGATFEGRVTSIAPAADPQSRVFDVEVTIPNPDGRLRPGMIGTVALGRAVAASAAPALTVPLNAVVKAIDDAGGYAVMVVARQGEAEVARERRIELGEVMGNVVAVVKGLTPADRVIVTGPNLLADGERVRVIP